MERVTWQETDIKVGCPFPPCVKILLVLLMMLLAVQFLYIAGNCCMRCRIWTGALTVCATVALMKSINIKKAIKVWLLRDSCHLSFADAFEFHNSGTYCMINVKCICTTQTFAFGCYILATLTIKHLHEHLLKHLLKRLLRRLAVPALTVVCQRLYNFSLGMRNFSAMCLYFLVQLILFFLSLKFICLFVWNVHLD